MGNDDDLTRISAKRVAPKMAWSDTSISDCPNCGKRAVVGIMSLCATCTCGYYYVDINEGRGWYTSRQSYEVGESAISAIKGVESAAPESPSKQENTRG